VIARAPARPRARPTRSAAAWRSPWDFARVSLNSWQMGSRLAASVLAAIPASLSNRAFSVEDVRAAAQRSVAFWRSGCDSLDAAAQSQLADARGQQSHAHDPGRPRVLKVTPGFAR